MIETQAASKGRARRRWWIGPVVLAAVAVGLRAAAVVVDIRRSGGSGLDAIVWVLVLAAGVGLAIWIPVGLVRSRARELSDKIAESCPGSLVVPAVATLELRHTVTVLAPQATLGNRIAWSIDPSGVTLWANSRPPTRIVDLPPSTIASIEQVMAETIQQSATALAFTTTGPDKRPLRMPFAAKSAKEPGRPLESASQDELVQLIRERANG